MLNMRISVHKNSGLPHTDCAMQENECYEIYLTCQLISMVIRKGDLEEKSRKVTE